MSKRIVPDTMKLPKVNKDQLIWALEDINGLDEYYLDLETGEIVSNFEDLLAELGIEEEDLESERYWYITPISSQEGYNFMVEFIETVEDEELKRRLTIAINGRGAFRMFKATLSEYPEERERWFKFHDTKMEEYADEWLEDVALTLKSRE
ncbi:MAG: hypothetical protein HXS48_26340 [Theionarchaea archaeon]|nr:hypothetical protein [Theionarchaea archaeon]